MGTRTTSPSFPRDATLLVEQNIDILQYVPPAGKEWTISELDDDIQHEMEGIIQRLREYSFLNIERRRDGRKKRNTYSVTPAFHDTLERVSRDRTTFCPCGHGGMVNRGDYYECGFNPCDETFSRDELDA